MKEELADLVRTSICANNLRTRPGGLEPPAFGSEVHPRTHLHVGSSCWTGVSATNLAVLDRPDDEDPTREPVHFPVHLLLGPHTGSSGVHSDADSEAAEVKWRSQ